MFLERIRLRSWIRRLRRKKRILVFRKAVNIPQQIRDSRTVCICMPPDHKFFYEARDLIKDISGSGKTITLILSRGQEVLAEHKGPVLTYPPAPKRPFPVREDQLGDIPRNFDIAIDLSPEPTVLTAYITGTRAKKLSVGIQSRDLDPFYTVLIHPAGEYMDSVILMLSFIRNV
ncbi:MAG: hypothetical protein PHC77_05300 [Candidatus Marinimicrobia bacterium]|nr:hypothetical protein [Candidatus Neomarinimicrobiota bacterium]